MHPEFIPNCIWGNGNMNFYAGAPMQIELTSCALVLVHTMEIGCGWSVYASRTFITPSDDQFQIREFNTVLFYNPLFNSIQLLRLKVIICKNRSISIKADRLKKKIDRLKYFLSHYVVWCRSGRRCDLTFQGEDVSKKWLNGNRQYFSDSMISIFIIRHKPQEAVCVSRFYTNW